MIAGPKTLTRAGRGRVAGRGARVDQRDIDAGVAAYNSGDFEAALTSYTAAEGDLGERPELHFNKGLALLAKDDKEGARKAFEHGTESEHAPSRRPRSTSSATSSSTPRRSTRPSSATRSA
jgi:tetratricopeptide (TPR) repeat protein